MGWLIYVLNSEQIKNCLACSGPINQNADFEINLHKTPACMLKFQKCIITIILDVFCQTPPFSELSQQCWRTAVWMCCNPFSGEGSVLKNGTYQTEQLARECAFRNKTKGRLFNLVNSQFGLTVRLVGSLQTPLVWKLCFQFSIYLY